MLKNIASFIIIFMLLSFAGSVSAHNYKTWSYSDVRILYQNSDQHIQRYCRDIRMDKETCHSLTKRRLYNSLMIYKKPDYGSKFIDYCFNEKLINSDFQGYFECMNDLNEKNNLNTAFKELNHHFIINNEMKNIVYNTCFSQYSLFDSRNRNSCIQEQEGFLTEFRGLWRMSHNNRTLRSGFYQCLPKFKNKDDLDRLIIDFKMTIECTRNI